MFNCVHGTGQPGARLIGGAVITDIAAGTATGNGLTTISADLSALRITEILPYTFEGCMNLESVPLPDSIQAIGAGAFSGTALTAVDMPDAVEVLEDELFSNCESLREISLPDNLYKIGGRVFFGCAMLDTISIAPDNMVFKVEDGILFNHNKTVLYRFPVSGTTEYTVPDSVISVASASFDNSKLTAVTLPSTLDIIGANAFSSCADLKTLIFQSELPPSFIERDAFWNTYIKNVYLPTDDEACINAYKSAFTGDSLLKHAFAEARFIKKSGPGEEPPPEPDEEGVLRDANGVRYRIVSETDRTVKVISETNNPYQEKNYINLVNIVIPPTLMYAGLEYTVTEIGNLAFFGSKNLVSIELPDSVTNIEGFAFSHCSSLETITLPDTLETLGEGAFAACASLTGIILPDGLKHLEPGLFSGCTSLKTIRLPGALETVNINNLFFECVKLEVFSIDADNLYFTVLDGVLYNKDMTELIKYPAGKPGPFTIPDTVKTIRPFAFRNCVALTDLTVPSSVEVIGSYAFADWDTLRSITFLSETPPPIVSHTAFSKTKDHAFTIYVPTEECIPAYRKALDDKLGGKTAFEPMPTPGNGAGGSNPGSRGGDNPSGTDGNGDSPTDYTPPSTSSSGGSSDSQNNSFNDTLSSTSDFRSLQGDLSRAIAAAISANSTAAKLRIMNYSRLSLDTLRQLAAEAGKSGKSCMINADTVQWNTVITRISFYANDATKGILLTGSVGSAPALRTKALFERYFDNRITVVSLAQQGGFGMSVFIAAKPDMTGLNLNTLYFYSYDKSTNSYSRIQTPRSFTDANGYLWFSTSLAGDIIITDKPLILRKNI